MKASIICMIAKSGNVAAARFDSDSVVLHVDNCASRCITNDLTDFVKPPRQVVGRVKGMGSDKVAVHAVGTIRWSVDDDEGMAHSFLIPGSLYIPESPARLFSPQHWAQERKDDSPKPNGTWQATYADHIVLVWGQQKYRKRIPFDKSNVASFNTSAGCKNFRVFRACIEDTDDQIDRVSNDYIAFDANLIVDDEDDYPEEERRHDEGTGSDDEPSVISIQQPARIQVDHSEEEDVSGPGYSKTTGNHETSYDHYSALIEDVPEDEYDGKLKPTSELMLWHCRLGHVPFSRIQQMAKKGQLPKRLADCRVPRCASCIYGKMTRRAKRTKNESSKIEARTITGPGACVSVDQLESSTLGLIGHMKGNPTVQRYRCPTV